MPSELHFFFLFTERKILFSLLGIWLENKKSDIFLHFAPHYKISTKFQDITTFHFNRPFRFVCILHISMPTNNPHYDSVEVEIKIDMQRIILAQTKLKQIRNHTKRTKVQLQPRHIHFFPTNVRRNIFETKERKKSTC